MNFQLDCRIFVYLHILLSGIMATFTGLSERVVILGGGIHGASIAYYLTKRGIKPTIIERTAVAAAASGKAGGFLARDWGSGPTVPLHQISFDMHETLAKEFNLESYRRIDTLSVNGARKGNPIASWLDGMASSSLMGGGNIMI